MEAIPMNIGHSTLPHMRVPALLKGNMIDLDLASLEGQWGILCCLPKLEFCDAVFLNQFRRTVKKQGALLLGMQHPAHTFLGLHLHTTKILSIPLLTDSTHRLGRALGLWSEPPFNQCQTFIFDPEGVIRDRRSHLFNWHGITLLLGILKQCQDFSFQPAQERNHNPATTNFMFAKQDLNPTLC
jgi:alkyl hydroperoxide reductase subunit AhpC